MTAPTKPDLAAIIARLSGRGLCFCEGGLKKHCRGTPCKSFSALLSAASASLAPVEGEIAELIKGLEGVAFNYMGEDFIEIRPMIYKAARAFAAEHRRANEAEEKLNLMEVEREEGREIMHEYKQENNLQKSRIAALEAELAEARKMPQWANDFLRWIDGQKDAEVWDELRGKIERHYVPAPAPEGEGKS